MPIQVSINGAGRIGLLVCRRAIELNLNKKDSSFQIAMLNDPFCTPENIMYRLKYDSIHGKLPYDVTLEGQDTIVIGGSYKIKITNEREPEKLPYKENKIQAVLECTGVFTTKSAASKHMGSNGNTGVKQVIISAPAGDNEVKTLVMGVNEAEYDKSKDSVVSNASCTTNCLAPVVKAIDEKFTVEWGSMSTVHAVTATQNTVDGASKKDFAGGRAAFSNIIPSSTGAAKAIGKVLPHLNGKIDGEALRVPVADVSNCLIFLGVKKTTNKEKVNEILEKYSNESMKGILGIAHQFGVSSDFVDDCRSSIVQKEFTMVLGEKNVKIMSWYDNEAGYSARVVDLLKFIISKW